MFLRTPFCYLADQPIEKEHAIHFCTSLNTQKENKRQMTSKLQFWLLTLKNFAEHRFYNGFSQCITMGFSIIRMRLDGRLSLYLVVLQSPLKQYFLIAIEYRISQPYQFRNHREIYVIRVDKLM